ncbi:MAG: O-antigen ligase family protein [Novosphingobium sp.]
MVACLLGGAAMVLGGGGSPAPVPEMMLQVLAACAAGLWILVARRGFRFMDADPKVWIVTAFVLALPAIQLVPLPAFIWQNMKGREVMAAALDLVGEKDSWRPWTLDSGRTLSALLATLPPVAFLVMVASLRRGGRMAVIAVIAAMAGVSLVIGAGQIAGGDSNALRFYERGQGFLTGFQANHSATADVLLIAMVAALATIRDYADFHPVSRFTANYRLATSAGLVAMFTIGVVLTGSRAGMLMLPLAWGACLMLVWPLLRVPSRTVLLAGAALLLAVVAGVIFSGMGLTAEAVGRFTQSSEMRPQIWASTIFVVKQYFPWGAGMGNFMTVFAASEPLETVSSAFVNRAHNDYLELLVEGGVFGAMALAGLSWTIAGLARKAWQKAPAGSRAQVVFSLTTLAVIALHSIVDYPLRSMSLAFVAAAAVALLMPLGGWGETRNANA